MKRKPKVTKLTVYDGLALGIDPKEIVGQYILFYCSYGRHKGVIVDEKKINGCLKRNCSHLEKYVLQGKSE